MILFWLSIWNVVGGFIVMIIMASLSESCSSRGAFAMADGFEFVNPCHIYRYNRVNWFGAIVVSIFYSLLCPIGTICYWFYKLCTVGRKY